MIIVDVSIICVDDKNPNGYLYAIVRRSYDINLIPVSGMEFEDSAWKDSRKILTVTLNPEDEYYHASVEEDRLDGKENCEQHVNMYKSHGWEPLC
jgi:hypothetical protein